MELLASGVGVVLIVATLARVGFPGVVFKPLEDPSLCWILWSAGGVRTAQLTCGHSSN